MKQTFLIFVTLTLIATTPMGAQAQAVQQGRAIASSDVLSQISMFNYRERRKSDLFFRGTPIAAIAEGKAEVEYQDGNARIKAAVKDLPVPSTLGPYTIYVLWALTPDGRAANVGVLADAEGGKGDIDTRYAAPQFALVVTAEPHFAVTTPSTMIVLYNVADNVRGTQSNITTLVERNDYSSVTRIAIDRDTPVELVQARYAVAIAEAAGAERFAARAYTTATEKLSAAELAQSGKGSQRRLVPGLAREAVIAGADARRAAIVASAAENAAQERAAAAAAARDAANAAAAEAAARAATAAAAERELAARTAAAEAAATARDDLRNRLNAALPTRESSRGLISEIGGVQFATGAAAINTQGRESLARFAGIVASYPSLRFRIEGHTDSVGSDASNRLLSLQRATSVRDYLIAQGVRTSAIDIDGFGASMPIADNSSPEGRARNRRVEIVLSGGLLDSAR